MDTERAKAIRKLMAELSEAEGTTDWKTLEDLQSELEAVNQGTIAADVRANPNLRQMINKSMEDYRRGNCLPTKEAIKLLSKKDFE